MYQVGILSKPGIALDCFKEQVKKTPFFKTQFFTESLPYVRSLKKGSFDALVILSDEFRPQNLAVLKQVKKYFPQMPILVFTEKDSSESLISILPKVLLLNIKAESRDVSGILLKMLNQIKVHPRLKKRYVTSYSVKLKAPDSKQHTAWIMNLAKEGACFRVFQPKFSKGDKIKIEVTLPELNKTHFVVGEVVWEKKEKTSDNLFIKSQKIGVRFSEAV